MRKTFNFSDNFQPSATHPDRKELVYGRMVIPFAKFWMRYVQRLEVFIQHAERIPSDGPAMVAINHTSYWDFVYGGIPAHFNGGRSLRYMAKKEIFDIPVGGRIMRACRHISVDRASGAASAREAVRRLKNGEIVGIFPEATISRSFEIKELRQGAATIARDGDAPLIPLILWGAQRIWTKNHKPMWFPKNAKVVMTVGEPVEVTEDAIETTERLHKAMQDLLEEARAEYIHRFGPMPEGEYWVPASLGGSAPTLEEATIEDREIHARRKRERAEMEARPELRREKVKYKGLKALRGSVRKLLGK